MKSTHAALAVLAAVATVAAVVFAPCTSPRIRADPTKRRRGDRIFGHIASLKADGDTYEMRFDPAVHERRDGEHRCRRGRGRRARRAGPQ